MYSGIDQTVQIEGLGIGSEHTLEEDENGNSGGMSEGFVDIHVAPQSVNVSTLAQQRASQDMESPEVVIEQLRRRIRELEARVQSQNAHLLDNERLKRNYAASIEALTKVKTEKDVIEENREKLLEERNFFQQQAEEYMNEIDAYKERLNDCNRQLIRVRNEADEKIKGLQKAVCFWREKHEKEKEHAAENRTQSSWSFKAVLSEHGGPEPGNKRNLDTPPQSKRRRHTFHQSPTVLPKCRNCLTVFDRLRPHEVQCRFHRSSPQPWKIWKKQLCEASQQFDRANTQGYMYWPCCEHVGLKEPPGCLKLKNHDLSRPDSVD